jgi:hypothetical protein
MSTVEVEGGDGGVGGVGGVGGLEEAAAIVSETDAVCFASPEFPVKTRVAVPATALDAAVRLTCCDAPTASDNVDGDRVTPVGAPAADTLTVPEKPEMAVAEMLMVCAAPPAVMLALAGVACNEKSDLFVTVPEPQPAIHSTGKAVRTMTRLHASPNRRMGLSPCSYLSLRCGFQAGDRAWIDRLRTLVKERNQSRSTS